MKYILIALFALIAMNTSARAHHVPSHLHDVTLKINGMVCDFCAQSITKVLKQNDAVDKVDINFDTKEVAINFKSGTTLKNEEIAKMIDYAGYSIAEVLR